MAQTRIEAGNQISGWKYNYSLITVHNPLCSYFEVAVWEGDKCWGVKQFNAYEAAHCFLYRAHWGIDVGCQPVEQYFPSEE